MRKAAVRDGDPTTTGGYVIGTSTRINDKGKKVALTDDHATCGNCKGTYRIFGTGKKMSDRGRCVVVDDDRVLCPCGKNRVIVGSNPGIFIEADGGQAGIRRTSAASTPSALSSAAKVYDEQFTLRDDDGYPLANVRYRARMGSHVVASGLTDAQGRTQRINTESAKRITLEVADL
ncbi:PAAR domain-containing protein [Paraburkholderia sp. BL10I2N1]|uniref:PAAR domain-containing protein n=1 Tax=Paraburkholderia sp. BL10I2N1 TaxID=1938796 RepID=UPI001060C68A|nr:PAAR domain-containing protein [Paraburkholderia sp. BL10I2N1]TDN70673.1 PAAR motif-containing protein [Paraburkholderia sp. BL10I2N1]